MEHASSCISIRRATAPGVRRIAKSLAAGARHSKKRGRYGDGCRSGTVLVNKVGRHALSTPFKCRPSS
jgi:hypothetical protein